VGKKSVSMRTPPASIVSTPKPTPSTTVAAMDWAKGLVDPFSVSGPKVPDLFCYPTITAQSKGVQVINSDSNGVVLGAIVPYPTISYVAVQGATSSSAMYQYPSKPVFAATTLTNLTALFSNYRVVSIGVRVRNLLAPLTATGRVILAPYIAANSVPGPNFIVSANIDGGALYQAVTGVAASGSNLMELPYSKEYSIQDLIDGTVIWSTRPVSSESYHFHSPVNLQSGSAQYYGQSVGAIAGSVGGVGFVESIDSYLPNNYTGLIVYAVGLPASTVSLELEYVFHYEGTPAMGISAGAVMPEQSKASPVDMNGMSSMLRQVVNSDPINLIAETALGSFGKLAMGALKRL